MSPVQAPQRLSLDAPGNNQPPSNFVQFIGQTQFRNVANAQVQIAVPSAKYLSVYNRTGHTMFVEVQADLGGNVLPFVLERGERVSFTFDFNIFNVFITDITYNFSYSPLAREDKSIGRRHGSNFPYVNNNAVAAPGGANPNGSVMVVASSAPIIQTSVPSDVPPTVNYSQSLLTANGTLLSQTPVLVGALIVSCSYFLGVHVFNPGSAVGNITVQYITPDNTVNGPTINYPPGFAGYIPIECDQIVVTASLTGQFVAGYQSVNWYPTNL